MNSSIIFKHLRSGDSIVCKKTKKGFSCRLKNDNGRLTTPQVVRILRKGVLKKGRIKTVDGIVTQEFKYKGE